MAEDATVRFLVLSDMHFGTPESSINNSNFRSALIDHITACSPWEEIVFIGDLLDINLSTLTQAIEGGLYEGLTAPLCGFRQFIQELDTRMKLQVPAKDLKDLTKKWIYVPGNHDYKIWDILSTKVACEDVLSNGKQMDSVPTPLMKCRLTGDESFFAGIFRFYGVQEQIVVEYPNHEINFGKESDLMVLTHGHYLDAKQTRFNDLSAYLSNFRTQEEIGIAIRTIFIETAQYQTVANAVSFIRSSRSLVNILVGPGALGSNIKKFFHQIGAKLLASLFSGESTKGKQLSADQLLNIEYYLKYFCDHAVPPRWFVFGHTHHQDSGKTDQLGVEVYNAGSCYLDRGMPVTFIEIETDAGGKPNVVLMCVTENSKVEKTP